LRTSTALSPRDRSITISSGSSVRSRRINTFNPAQITDEPDSPNSRARKALEKRAFEACRATIW
jgi:hypothetical protein